MSNDSIRMSGIVRQSITDGPGLRFVVFLQGCPHACPGCHNPDTHAFDGGYLCSIDRLLQAIDQNPLLAGVTLSGGEPFVHAEALIPFVHAVRKREKNIRCYSGYRWEELLQLAQADEKVRELINLLDVIVDGRYIAAERDLTLRFRGSRNQRMIDVAQSLTSQRVILVP